MKATYWVNRKVGYSVFHSKADISRAFGLTKDEILNLIRTKKTFFYKKYEQETNAPLGVIENNIECWIEKVHTSRREHRDNVKKRRSISRSLKKRLKTEEQPDISALADMFKY